MTQENSSARQPVNDESQSSPENTANMKPDYSGNLVDTSPKDYSFNAADFPLLVKLAREIGKDILTFDLETSDLLDSPTFGIAELGMLRVRHKDGRILVNARYLNPDFPMGAKASEITGITDAMLADKEIYGEKHAKFMNQAAASCMVLQFNGRNFDIPGIYKVHERYGLPMPNFVDVLDVRDFWVKMSGSKKGKLGEVVEHYGIEVMDAHRASGDVAMTALLLNHMIWRHGIDAALSCRVVDQLNYTGDGQTHAPKAFSATYVLRQRLIAHFNAEGVVWNGAQALAKELGLSDEEAREADYELSNLIRDKKVPVDLFKKQTLQDFIFSHLDAACAKEGVAANDPTLKLKPIMEFIKKKKGCPKGMDYIQLRCAFASLPAAEQAPTAPKPDEPAAA